MLNISFGEISIVLIVAALFFGVDEIKSALKFFRSTQNKANALRKKLDTEIRAIENEVMDDEVMEQVDPHSTSSTTSSHNSDATTGTIVDLEGNHRTCYSLKHVEDKLKIIANQQDNQPIEGHPSDDQPTSANKIDDKSNAN